MTNQVNQDAFEKWLIDNYREYPPPLSEIWHAATQASESEINSLKQRVEELQADNERLREALKCIDEDLVNPVHYRLVKEALSSINESKQ